MVGYTNSDTTKECEEEWSGVEEKITDPKLTDIEFVRTPGISKLWR